MRRQRLYRSIIFFTLGGACLTVLPGSPPGSVSLLAADTPAGKTEAKGGSFLNAIPKDTVLVLRTPSARLLTEKLKKSPFWQLKDQADVKALVAKAEGDVNKGLAKAKESLGFDPLEVLRSIEGEWLLSVGNLETLAGGMSEGLAVGQAPDIQTDKIPVLLAFDAGSAAGKVRESLQKVFALAEKEGAKRETADFGGGKITTLKEEDKKAGDAAKKAGDKGKDDGKDGAGDKPGEDDKEDGDDDGKDGASGPKHQILVGEVGSRFYVSLNRAYLESCMGKIDAAGPDSLASNPLFQETVKISGEGDVFGYVNVKQITTALGNALSTTFIAFFWQKFDALIFGKSFNNLAVSLRLEEDAVRETFFVHNGGASDGILGVFKADTFPPVPPAFIPPDAPNFSSTAFNPEQLGKIVKDLVQTVMAFQGQATDVDTLCEQNVGVKLSAVIGSMGKRLHTFMSAKKSDNPFEAMSYVLELKDEGPLQTLLKKALEMSQGKMESAKFKDRDLYSFDAGPLSLAIAAADKLFLVAGSRSEAEKVIARSGSPATAPATAAPNEEFKKLAAGLPAQVSMLSYTSADYWKNYLSSLLSGYADDADEEAKLLVGAAVALGDVLGAAISYGDWKEKGLFMDGTMQYRQKK